MDGQQRSGQDQADEEGNGVGDHSEAGSEDCRREASGKGCCQAGREGHCQTGGEAASESGYRKGVDDGRREGRACGESSRSQAVGRDEGDSCEGDADEGRRQSCTGEGGCEDGHGKDRHLEGCAKGPGQGCCKAGGGASHRRQEVATGSGSAAPRDSNVPALPGTFAPI
ncbi:MAG: hypothetical protein IT303_18410 [Dehalococcoidia bacterium]|nr:hypothetical protein [Dehalococcoidia bacterium]